MNTLEHAPHPVRLVVEDDYHRNRATVFFRLILAIPHLVWFTLWTFFVVLMSILNWLVSLFTGKPPGWFHRLMCSYIRYQAHVTAYLTLVGNPYPGFAGEEGEYPIDIVLPAEPVAQRRLTILVRLLLALPALIFVGALAPSPTVSFPMRGRRRFAFGSGGLLASVCAVLGWFASLALGRMPKGLRDAGAYAIGYRAQATAYFLLVTERYPNSDPTAMLESVQRPPAHPVRVVGEAEDLRRSRVTVFFRLLLGIPHLVWLYLWGYAANLVAIVNWFATLAMGRSPRWCHRFLSRYVRYGFHVVAFLSLAANPFPGFTGRAGSYPLDVELPAEPQRQNRWKTLFRIVLAIPAFFVAFALEVLLGLAAVGTWFYALVLGRAPWGLRNAMAYALRYYAQTNAYVYLLTDRYPHASPLEGEDAAGE